MLDATAWRVEPWSAASGNYVCQRIVRHGTQPIGFVGCPAPNVGWFAPLRYEFCEAEDGSHVGSIVRGWWRRSRWTILEAEENLVGTLHGPALYDPWGRFLAQMRPIAGSVQLVDVDERVWAWQKGDRITLDANFPVNPYGKMLVLAAFLGSGPTPADLIRLGNIP